MKSRISRENIDDLQAKLTDSLDDLIQALEYKAPSVENV